MIYILLVVYQIKHFLADYPLQNKFMLGKFLPWPKFVLPLLSHGAVHAVFTFAIAACLKPLHVAVVLGLFDMTVHCVVDWIKANPSIGGRFKPLTKATYQQADWMSKGLSMADGSPLPTPIAPNTLDAYKKAGLKDIKSNTFFWWALGADQMAHHLTHYLLIWAMLP